MKIINIRWEIIQTISIFSDMGISQYKPSMYHTVSIDSLAFRLRYFRKLTQMEIWLQF